MSLVETVDLCQSYAGKLILNGINLGVEQGEVFAIIGPTGAGKTTLLRLLNLLDLPTSGRIYFDGIDTAGLKRAGLEVRRRMAFVLQKPVVFGMSVYDNIACGLRWRGVGKSEIQKKVGEIMELSELVEYRDRDARTLSGGEVQRVAIARAVVTEPELLLMDEPTANLDPGAVLRIEEFIASIMRRHNTTIITATHDMSQGQRLADKVGVLLDGRIVQAGSWDEVFNYPRNKEVARFVGTENIIKGVVASSEGGVVTVAVDGGVIEALSDYPVGAGVCACIRPEEVTLSLAKIFSSARNSFVGRVERLVATGPLTRVEVDCGFPLVCLITQKPAEETGLARGKSVYATFKATGVHVVAQGDFKESGEK